MLYNALHIIHKYRIHFVNFDIETPFQVESEGHRTNSHMPHYQPCKSTALLHFHSELAHAGGF